jgi:hypothetical protein
MAIQDRHVDQTNPTVAGEQSGGLHPSVLNVMNAAALGFYKASAIAGVFTKQTLSSTMNASSAVGTDVDFPRNAAYQFVLTNGTASSAMISGGTFLLLGTDIRGSATTETINMAQLASSSLPQQGTVIWGSVGTVSFSNFSLHTSASTASNSVSFSVGVGNVVGMPQAVRSTNAVVNLFWGTSKMLTQSGASSTNNQYTVVTGPFGAAGISISTTLTTASLLNAYYFLSR